MKKISNLLLFLSVCGACLGQSLDELLPSADELNKVQFGMLAKNFSRERPAAKPFSLSGKVDFSKEFTGNIFEENHNVIVDEVVKSYSIYAFTSNKLSSYSWATKENNSIEVTKRVRDTLWRMHGTPKIGYIPRVRRNKIAKLAVEAFMPNGDDSLIVVLTSSADGLEVSAINYAYKKNESAEHVYFSYDERLAEIRQRNNSSEEDPSPQDFLAELIVKEPKPKVERKRTVSETSRDRNVSSAPTSSRDSASSKADSKTSQAQKQYWLWGLLVIVLFGIFILIRKK